MIRSNRSRPLPKLLAVLAATAAIAAIAPSSASATGPLVTDPAGDVSHLCASVSLTCPVEDAFGLQPSSIDIVSADIQAAGASFDFIITVVDLSTTVGANEHHGMTMQTTDGYGISLGATRNSSGSIHANLSGGQFEGDYITAVPVVYDDVDETITITVTSSELSSATGTTFQAGSTLSGFKLQSGQLGTVANAYVVGFPSASDSAASTATFTA